MFCFVNSLEERSLCFPARGWEGLPHMKGLGRGSLINIVSLRGIKKNIKAETDTTLEGIYFGWPNQPSSGTMRILNWDVFLHRRDETTFKTPI